MSTSNLAAFTGAALRRPSTVGAIAPSGPRLARRLASVVPGDGQPTVVELGPGTGAITGAISARLGGRGDQLALEIDEDMLQRLRRTFPQVRSLHADAAQLPDVLAANGFEHADAVVSGLPWTLFKHERQRSMLESIARSLAPGAVFTTFTYSHTLPIPAARRFRALLEDTFSEVTRTRTIWANVPPALTYECR